MQVFCAVSQQQNKLQTSPAVTPWILQTRNIIILHSANNDTRGWRAALTRGAAMGEEVACGGGERGGNLGSAGASVRLVGSAAQADITSEGGAGGELCTWASITPWPSVWLSAAEKQGRRIAAEADQAIFLPKDKEGGLAVAAKAMLQQAHKLAETTRAA
jgi:hypothetical protein